MSPRLPLDGEIGFRSIFPCNSCPRRQCVECGFNRSKFRIIALSQRRSYCREPAALTRKKRSELCLVQSEQQFKRRVLSSRSVLFYVYWCRVFAFLLAFDFSLAPVCVCPPSSCSLTYSFVLSLLLIQLLHCFCSCLQCEPPSEQTENSLPCKCGPFYIHTHSQFETQEGERRTFAMSLSHSSS